MTLEDPRISRFIQFWQDIRGEKALPSRKDLDICRIPGLLPYLALMEVMNGGDDFYARLAGEYVIDNSGLRGAPRLLSEMVATNPSALIFMKNLRRCIAAREPIILSSEFRSSTGMLRRTHSAHAPFSDDGQTIDRILCFVIFLQKRGDHWVVSSWEP